ncbi:MAG: exodeoxyribonuclease VII small subunit [Chlamydiota bacterium]
MKQESPSFEKAFLRLEKILEQMNEGQVSLEESLKLFEEANTLIIECDKFLTSAQGKIEILIKNRSGALSLDKEKKPMTEPFSLPKQQVLSEDF